MAMGTSPKWIDVGGIKTRYFEAGEGPPLLLVTGGNFGAGDAASIVETWDRNFLGLANEFRVIAVDKLGQGHTDNPSSDEAYTMDAVVHHLAGFLGALQVGPTHLVGQSRGAMAACCLTLWYPHLVQSCTLVNTSTLAPGIGLNEVFLGGTPHPHFTRDGQRWVFERCEVDKRLVDDHFLDEAEHVFALPKYLRSVQKMEDEGLKARLFVPRLRQLKSDTLQRLANGGMGRPTQVVWGTQDHTASVDRGMDLFHIIARRERNATMHVFNRAGHHPYREHPAQFNEIMFGLLRQTGQ
jgi:2-hydroxy-6-oxonona-2,4-dienedioate hydrolase